MLPDEMHYGLASYRNNKGDISAIERFGIRKDKIKPGDTNNASGEIIFKY